MKYRIRNTKTTLFILAIYQILGGIAGLGATARLLLRTETINGALLLIFLVATGLYLLSVKSGSLLLCKDYQKGLIMSIVTQLFQIIAIGTGSSKYDFFSGGMLAVGVDFTHELSVKFEFGLISQFDFAINISEGQEYFIFFNLLALFLIAVLVSIYKEMKFHDGPFKTVSEESK